MTKHPSNLPRLFAEGFVVVLSILLAFGIDASWDARRDRIEAGAVLADLGREMSENLELLEFVIGIREARSAAALQLLAGAGSFSGDESLRKALAVVFLDYSSVNLRTGAYSLFLAGGSTEQIQSQELRSLLASWPGLVEENTEDELIEAEMTNAVLIPFLSTRIGIAAVYSDHPAPEETYGTFPQSELEFAWTPRGLLNDPEFQNLTVMRLARNRILVREARALRDATERMVALLEEEIAR